MPLSQLVSLWRPLNSMCACTLFVRLLRNSSEMRWLLYGAKFDDFSIMYTTEKRLALGPCMQCLQDRFICEELDACTWYAADDVGAQALEEASHPLPADDLAAAIKQTGVLGGASTSAIGLHASAYSVAWICDGLRNHPCGRAGQQGVQRIHCRGIRLGRETLQNLVERHLHTDVRRARKQGRHNALVAACSEE